MPAGDGRGPEGVGPMSGRGMGYCSGYDSPGWGQPGPGRGYGRRGPRGYQGTGGWRRRNWQPAARGRRWAMGWGYPTRPPMEQFAPPSQQSELEMLSGEADWLKEQLDMVSARISALEVQD